MSFLPLLINHLLFGFGLYSMLFLLGRRWFSNSKGEQLDDFDRWAVRVAVVAGFLYLGVVMGRTTLLFMTLEDVEAWEHLHQRLFGRYAYGFWVPHLLNGSVLLLGIKRLRASKWIRLVVSLMVMLSIEKWIIVMTSFHRDYGPEEGLLSAWLVVNPLLYLVGFLLVTYVLFIVGRSPKPTVPLDER